MPVETFTQAEFAAALKVIKAELAARYPAIVGADIGIDQGEYCYTLTPFADRPWRVHVRSSVKPGGTSAACGDDSIRCAIADAGNRYVGGKIGGYTTRVKGWQGRLTKVIGRLAGIIGLMGTCDKCKAAVKPFRVKKEGPNKGKLFLTCGQPCGKTFQWIDESDEIETSKGSMNPPSAEWGKCEVCDRALAKRTAGPNSKKPGVDYAVCPSGAHSVSFKWLDSPKQAGSGGASPGASKGQPQRQPEPADRGDAWEGETQSDMWAAEGGDGEIETSKGSMNPPPSKPVKGKRKSAVIALSELIDDMLAELVMRGADTSKFGKRLAEIRKG